MLLVSREQWEEVFDRLDWGPDRAAELWSRMGGGARNQLDWPEVYRLILTTGWSERHAQALWITLNNFVEPPKQQEPAKQPTEEPQVLPEVAAGPELTPLAPAPWERAAAVYAGKVDDIQVVQQPAARRGMTLQLPSFLAEIDRRLLALLGVVVVLVGGFLILGGSSGSDSSSSSSPQGNSAPAPSANVALARGAVQTYFTWKAKNPALQLCLMTKGCTTPQLNARIKAAGLAGQQAGLDLYHQIGKSYAKATFKELPNKTIAITIPTGKGAYCGSMAAENGSWKMLSGKDYSWANLMLGTTWKPC